MDRRKAVIPRGHRMDAEYQAYLRRRERQREQTESNRQQQEAGSQRRHRSLTSVYSSCTYQTPRLYGTASHTQPPAGGSGRERGCGREQRDGKTASRLPAITKGAESGRKKTALVKERESRGLLPQRTLSVIQPRIIVQKKLHTRQLPADQGAKESGRGGRASPPQARTCAPHRKDQPGRRTKQRRDEKRERGGNGITTVDALRMDTTFRAEQERLTRSDAMRSCRKPAPIPPSTSLGADNPPSSRELGGRPQANPSSASSRTSPFRSISDCFNELLERNIEDEETGSEDDADHLPIISASPLPNSEPGARSGRAEPGRGSSEDLEVREHGSARRTNVLPTRTHNGESYLDSRDDGRGSIEGPSSIDFQDGVTNEDALDFIAVELGSSVRSNRAGTLISNRPRPDLISVSVSPIRSTSHGNGPWPLVAVAPSAIEMSHGYSIAALWDLLEVGEGSTGNTLESNGEPVTVSGALETLLPPVIQEDTRDAQNHTDRGLHHASSRASPEDGASSPSIRQPSSIVPYIAPLGLVLAPSAPSVETLQETLNLVFLTMSMMRSSERRDRGRGALLAPSNAVSKPKADPERLRKLQESLLQEESEEEGDLCRICLMAGDTPENSLIAPCRCVGSLKYVHQECLKRWLMTKITSGAKLGAVRTCEMCRQSLAPEVHGFDVNEHYRNHKEAQEQGPGGNSGLYLVLLLHLYERRYRHLLRVTNSQERITELSRRISDLRGRMNGNSGDQDSDVPNNNPLV